MLLRAAMPITAARPAMRADGPDPADEQRRQHAARGGQRQGQEDRRRQPPAAERRLQQQEDPDRDGERKSGDAPAQIELRLGGTEHLGVVLRRHRQGGNPGS